MRGTYEIFLWILLIFSTITDLFWGKIYNGVTFSAIAFGLFYRFFFISTSDGYFSLLGIAIAFLIYFPLYFFKVISAGDVKLLMAIGSWATPHLTFYFAISGILVATFVGLLKMATTLGLKKFVPHFLANIYGKKTELHHIAFAPAFLCSYLLIQVCEQQGWL